MRYSFLENKFDNKYNKYKLFEYDQFDDEDEDDDDDNNENDKNVESDKSREDRFLKDYQRFKVDNVKKLYSKIKKLKTTKIIHKYIKSNIELLNISEGISQLVFFAVDDNNYSLLEELLKYDSDLDVKNKFGWTALMYACQTEEQYPLVKLLLEHGANPNIGNNESREMPITIALHHYVPETVQILLENNVDPNGHIGTISYLECMLNCPPDKKVLEIVKLLLEYGANPNELASKGAASLLIKSCWSGYAKFVELLLEYGADINYISNYGTALGNGITKDTIARMLLEHGADPNSLNNDGDPIIFNSPNKEIMDLLLEHGADPNSKNSKGITILQTIADKLEEFHATYSFDDKVYYEMMESLISHGANINEKDNSGSTFLNRFSFPGSIDILKWALDHGANPNIRDLDGSTAMMTACLTNNIGGLKLLLVRGANPNIQNNINGKTALMYSCSRDNNKAVKILLERGANPNIQNKDGKTALFCMGIKKSDNYEHVETLLKNGADPNIQDVHGRTVLMDSINTTLYASVITLDLIKLLLEHGADPNIQDEDGNTALILAFNTHLDVELCMQLLLENGANPDIQNNKGISAIDVARMNRQENIEKMMIESKI